MADLPGIPTRNQAPASRTEEELLAEVHRLRARDSANAKMVEHLKQQQAELRLRSEAAPAARTKRDRALALVALVTALGGGAGISTLLQTVFERGDETARLALESSKRIELKLDEAIEAQERDRERAAQVHRILECWAFAANGRRAFARQQGDPQCPMDPIPLGDEAKIAAAPRLRVDLPWPDSRR